MENQNMHYRRIIPALFAALVLGCFSFSPAVQANERDDSPSIVGLWRVHYMSGGVEIFQSFDQWHSDGQEFEVANAFGALCQGNWKQVTHSTVKLFHVGWNYDTNGQLTGYFEETQRNTVSHDGNTYQGTWDIKNFDTNGNFLNEQTGTLRATRLSVK
jgi:hypothetical protein